LKKSAIVSAFEKFNNLKILVVGDIMIDSYLLGKVDRISPEAPVPIVSITKKENRLGGAANVALNIAALGATPIICSVTGNDNNADEMFRLINLQALPTHGIVKSENRITTVKTRIISQHQHMLRFDEEITNPLSVSEEKLFISKIKEILDNETIDAIVFEDYNKGALTEKVIAEVIELANKKNIITTVDPKKENFFAYKNVTLFKPNLKELKEGLKIDFDKKNIDELVKADVILKSKLHNKISLITLSEMGVFYSSQNQSKLIPAHKRNIADVSGAGDTVISVATLSLSVGLDMEEVAMISNLSGGLVCEKTGVVPIDKNQLLEEALKLCNN
jgi:D-glycero-beta-D-manno-heptose-7-phosphate kinase